ncbi:MAG TPA: glycosyltransferase [Solirubrobacteraceae bacterium]
MPEPLLSVVVSTHNRPAPLARLLAGLREQALAHERFEVIVVDDGSVGPGTRTVLADELGRGTLRLRTVNHQVAQGPASGRNSGWRAAQAPLIAFTDDDCVPDAGWLSAALAASGRHPGAIIQGRTEPNPTELWCRGVFTRTVSVDTLGPHYETCNIVYPRAVLESLGGFDEAYGPRPTAEDTDLAWRAIETGCATVFAPDAVVFHAVEELGVRGSLSVASRWGPAVRVFAAHPQLRATLERQVFWNVWHYLVWRSLLALVAPHWLRRMILTMHLLELRKRARLAGAGAWAVPFLLVHDLVECWAVARGAVRHRTLVL